MAKLYYGNGNCTIEGSDIRVVHIKYRGAIEIDDKTSGSFFIKASNKGIIVAPLGKGTLNNLFDYVGEFKILSVGVAGNGEKIPTTIHRVMDYTELLNTNSEDMTTKSEDLSSTYVSGRKVPETVLKQPHLTNLHTSNRKSELFLKDGTLYEGHFHIHLSDNNAMSGGKHTEDSQDLYFNHGKPTKNTGVPYGAVKQGKEARRQKIKNRFLRKGSSKRVIRGNY